MGRRKHFTQEQQQQGQAGVEADPADEVHYPELWGMKGNGAITSPCPNCAFAYADGGYCPECGWMKPIRIDEHGTHSGRRF